MDGSGTSGAGGLMRYITATVGALFLFVALSIFGLVLTAFPILQGVLKISFGYLSLTFRNPIWLVGPILGIIAGVHSFRATLKRYEKQQHK
jgi:hypothetical protein